MLRNYLKVAWRNITNNKVYSALNIVGLAAGMAVALLIGLWVNYQYSFDSFLPDGDSLYQVRRNFNSNGDTLTFSTTSLRLADALRNNIPEIAQVAETDQIGAHGLKVGETRLYLNGLQAASSFLTMFRYPLVSGNATSALSDPYSIVLTESTAKALFGNADPVGRMVRVDNRDNLKVTGVLKDIPANATLQFKYILPFSYYEYAQNWVKTARAGNFGDNAFWIFVQLKPGISYSQVAPKIRDIEKSETTNVNAINSNVILQPMHEWHLFADYKNGKAVGGFIEYVRIFSVIGALVLLIACINFINLSTARSAKRAKEVGVRKAIGSLKKDLVLQFLTESALITFLSFLLSLMLVRLTLPVFNSLTGTTIALPLGSPVFWLLMTGFIFFITLLAGSRPAFYLSSFNPVKVLKGTFSAGRSAAFSRRVLVVTQFSCSIALIISTIIIYQQIQHAKDRPTGYQISRLMTTDLNEDLSRNYTPLKNELLQSGLVDAVTQASSPATGVYSHGNIDRWPGKYAGETIEMGYIFVGSDYFKTLGMKMKLGREFMNSGADTSSVIFNEAAIKRMRLKNPINQVITKSGKQYRIVGVVKDALMASPYQSADPTAFVYGGGWNMIYRLSPSTDPHKAVEKLTQMFNKYNPAYPYSYRFVDDDYNKKFSEEMLVGKLSGIFAGLAVLISCLGLFGLAAFVAEQRTREIGIRKVLGATVGQMWLLLSQDFLLLVFLSCLIASPVALYFLQHWLQKYEYRITIGPGVFIISAGVALAVTLITISTQAIKAAAANPAKSLKTE
ncbi:MAG TPA: ABC transporter permease [Mucilaginibacter sp.]|nr:ABC transporter permease [Mucilaginibacter sp.]